MSSDVFFTILFFQEHIFHNTFCFLFLSFCYFTDFDGKAVHLAYRDKLKLVAYLKQIAHGKLDDAKLPPPGYLDVVGNDRRYVNQGKNNFSFNSGSYVNETFL